jgi:amphi-Trp domain-containing protein
MATEEFKHESLQDCASIVRYLKALIEGLESGRLEFGTDDQELSLEPRGLLELEVRAKRKGGRSKVALKLGWREGHEKTSNGSDSLTIRGA